MSHERSFKPPIVKLSNILYIRGVFKDKSKSLESIIDSKFMNNEEVTIIDTPPVYEELPSLFTTVEAWPTSTVFKCWTCNGSCDGRPITIITSFDKDKLGNLECYRVGCFNTWPCAAFHIEFFMNNNETLKIYLCKLYEIFNGREHRGDIKSAMPPWTMTEYGGTYARKEYYRLNESRDKKFNAATASYEKYGTSHQKNNDPHDVTSFYDF